MEDKDSIDEYVERFLQFSNQVERKMKRLLIVLLALLILCQIGLQIAPIRKIGVPVEQLEGERLQ